MITQPLRVGLIGCGNIAVPYARDLVTYPDRLALVGYADLDPARAETLATQYGGHAYPTVEALLADPTIDLVINLTTHHAHYEVTRRCLEAGKHVQSEKPLALTVAEARALVDLADARGLRLACAPFTWMFEAQQTAWQTIRAGRLGPVRLAYAEVNWGRIESWHPEPESFYAVGPLFDVGVYPLHLLTSIFGPARRVAAFGQVLHPDRVTKRGVAFHVRTPDFLVALIELAAGPLVRLTTNFYVTQQGKQAGIELHGDAGSLYLSSWHMPNAAVEYADFNQPYERLPPVREPQTGVRWGWAALELAEAIAAGRPHRASGEQAAHVVEILCAATAACQSGVPVGIVSTFQPPEPMPWALSPV
jgi:predicted dehydrogenase